MFYEIWEILTKQDRLLCFFSTRKDVLEIQYYFPCIFSAFKFKIFKFEIFGNCYEGINIRYILISPFQLSLGNIAYIATLFHSRFSYHKGLIGFLPRKPNPNTLILCPRRQNTSIQFV